MERNFFRRVEVAFPVRRESHAARIVKDLETCLADDAQAWMLRPDGRYERVPRRGEHGLSAQDAFLSAYAAGATAMI